MSGSRRFARGSEALIASRGVHTAAVNYVLRWRLSMHHVKAVSRRKGSSGGGQLLYLVPRWSAAAQRGTLVDTYGMSKLVSVQTRRDVSARCFNRLCKRRYAKLHTNVRVDEDSRNLTLSGNIV